MLKLDLQPIPDGFRWRSKYGHLTYSSYLSHEQLVAHAKMITSTPLVGWSVVQCRQHGLRQRDRVLIQAILQRAVPATRGDYGLLGSRLRTTWLAGTRPLPSVERPSRCVELEAARHPTPSPHSPAAAKHELSIKVVRLGHWREKMITQNISIEISQDANLSTGLGAYATHAKRERHSMWGF